MAQESYVAGAYSFQGSPSTKLEIGPAGILVVSVNGKEVARFEENKLVVKTGKSIESEDGQIELNSLSITGNLTATGTFTTGSNVTDAVAIKGIYRNPANIAVTVPAITDPDIAKVDVNVAAAFSMQPAVGDAVIAIPMEAMEANARILGCYVTGTDQITLVFGSEGGNVTGGAKNFRFLLLDLT